MTKRDLEKEVDELREALGRVRDKICDDVDDVLGIQDDADEYDDDEEEDE
jgi:hypothetical protein